MARLKKEVTERLRGNPACIHELNYRLKKDSQTVKKYLNTNPENSILTTYAALVIIGHYLQEPDPSNLIELEEPIAEMRITQQVA